MVCCFHLYCGNGNLFPVRNAVKEFFSYGYLGVEIFFLLSGFIVCYTIPPTYDIRNFKTFILKRIVRVHPPYLISIILVLLLNFASNYITKTAFNFSAKDILANLFYLPSVGVGKYLSPVYWTLGIEFQFYLIIALIIPFLKYNNLILIFVLCTLVMPFSSLNHHSNIIPYLLFLGFSLFG